MWLDVSAADPAPPWQVPLRGPQAQAGPAVTLPSPAHPPAFPMTLPAEAPLRLRGALSREIRRHQESVSTRGLRPGHPPASGPVSSRSPVAVVGLFVQAAPTLTRWGHDPVWGAVRGPLLSPPAACTSPGSVLPACKLVLTPLLRETIRPHFLLPTPHFYTQTHSRAHTPR